MPPAHPTPIPLLAVLAAACIIVEDKDTVAPMVPPDSATDTTFIPPMVPPDSGATDTATAETGTRDTATDSDTGTLTAPMPPPDTAADTGVIPPMPPPETGDTGAAIDTGATTDTGAIPPMPPPPDTGALRTSGLSPLPGAPARRR